eukprot:scaffold458640_cov98-Attheya_sp.AAC.1
MGFQLGVQIQTFGRNAYNAYQWTVLFDSNLELCTRRSTDCRRERERNEVVVPKEVEAEERRAQNLAP